MNSNVVKKKNKNNKIFRLKKKEGQFLVQAIFISILLFFIIIGLVKFLNLNKSTNEVGDTIGGILGTIFSFFGSILVFMALKAQIKANQIINKQFTIQQKKESIQSFENTFFNLVNFQLNLIINIEKSYDRSRIRRSPKIFLSDDDKEFIAKGKLVFEFEYNIICKYLDDYYFSNRGYEIDFEEITFNDDETRLSVFRKIYSVYYSETIDNQFGNYFRSLYRLIKIIDSYEFDSDNSILDFEKKYFYTSIIRAQFSDYELRWIFLNGLSKMGTKFKPLIEKYSLLKNINTNDEILENYVQYYNSNAIGK